MCVWMTSERNKTRERGFDTRKTQNGTRRSVQEKALISQDRQLARAAP